MVSLEDAKFTLLLDGTITEKSGATHLFRASTDITKNCGQTSSFTGLHTCVWQNSDPTLINRKTHLKMTFENFEPKDHLSYDNLFHKTTYQNITDCAFDAANAYYSDQIKKVPGATPLTHFQVTMVENLGPTDNALDAPLDGINLPIHNTEMNGLNLATYEVSASFQNYSKEAKGRFLLHYLDSTSFYGDHTDIACGVGIEFGSEGAAGDEVILFAAYLNTLNDPNTKMFGGNIILGTENMTEAQLIDRFFYLKLK
jgi:hypothetical protein